ncbi:MAG: CBS domain-containing protein [Candidatus Aenigmatarchaeota archaeon]
MLVGEAMTKKVITFKPEDTLETVLERLTRNRITGAPVVEKGKVVGLVTEGDVIKAINAYDPQIRLDTDEAFAVVFAVLKHGVRGKEFDVIKKDVIGSGKIRVRHFMQKRVITIQPEARLEAAAARMVHYKVKRLPVVTKDGKLVGIISRADIIEALGS